MNPMSNSELEAPVASSTLQGQPGEDPGNVVTDLTLYEFKEQLLLLSTLVSTVTYVAGLNLPGGSWEQDVPGGHVAGDPILPDIHYHRYLAFYYCNATAFATSLVVSLILIILQKMDHVWTSVLRVVMALNLLSLMGSYGAGSCQDAFTTIYAVVAFSVLVFCIIGVLLSYLWLYGYGDNEAHSDSNSNSISIPHSRHDALKRARAEMLIPQAKEKDKENMDALMLLASFAITIAYVAGLSPPGGFWISSKDGHCLSDPVLQARGRFRAFFVCNTTSFAVSLLIVVFLLEKMMLGEKALLGRMTWFQRKELKGPIQMRLAAPCGLIVVALLGLMGAYAAGSSRGAANTVLLLTIPVCVFLLLALVYFAGYFNQMHVTLGWFKARFRTPRGTGWDLQDDQITCNPATLLAILVVSITYQAGLDPPGGLWQEDSDGHKMGHPVLQTTDPTRYRVFFYSNSAAFVTSLVIIMILQSKFLLTRHTLRATLVLNLLGLITAYGAGSTRDVSTSIYIIALAGLILVYFIVHITIIDHEAEPDSQDALKDLEDERKVLLLVAILAATLTYQAGLTPPGGFWLGDDQGLGRRAVFPTLLDNHPRRYNTFFYCNATGFMASVTIILLLVNPKIYRLGIRCYALYVCMMVGILGLMGAYAAGSSRHLKTSIYVLTLVGAVLAFIASLLAIFWLVPFVKSQKGRVPSLNPFRKSQEGTYGQVEAGFSISKMNNKRKYKLEYLMLLAILAASMTYQTGLKPPGGLWQDNNSGHLAGNPILRDINKHRYNAFFYSNSASFMASIVVIIMLLPLMMLHDYSRPIWLIHMTILFDMMGLLVAYAAGSTRTWEASRNVMCLIVPVLAYIGLYAALSVFCHRKEKTEVTTHTSIMVQLQYNHDVM